MGKASRRKHAAPPLPTKDTQRIQLTPREAKDLQGLCAVASLAVIALQQQMTEELAAARAPADEELARLTKKYAKAGMRAGVTYTLDVATHSLVEVRQP